MGGGISFPPVPLASEIVEHCKAKDAKECARTTEPPGKQLIDIYSHWFDQAYPQPGDRQEYLRELIEGKPLSHANLYLAHLLLEKTITNLVVTPNFDDFLSRALTLFGKPHIVCGHPGTVGRIHPDHDDIQIIHVHGTYWFYDCCKLLGEIKERSQPSDQTSLTMASLLDRILWDRSPLVIGYGGWEGDVIMAALNRRLQSPLGHNVYWFCYRKAEVDSLPDWLRSNPQVNFVVPSPREPSSSKKQNEPYLSAETKEFSEKKEAKPRCLHIWFSISSSKSSHLNPRNLPETRLDSLPNILAILYYRTIRIMSRIFIISEALLTELKRQKKYTLRKFQQLNPSWKACETLCVALSTGKLSN